MKRKFRWLMISIGIIYLIMCIVIFTLFTKRLVKNTVKTNSYYTNFSKNKVNEEQHIKIDSKDFKYHYFKNKNSHKTIILVHGVTSSKENTSLLAQNLFEQKYNVVLYDQRVHGENKNIGTIPTFGYWEKEDINKIINNINKKYPQNSISLYGVSMGAASVLAYAQKYDYLNKVKSYICESVYKDMYTQSSEESKNILPFGIFPFRWVVDLGFKSVHNFSSYDVNFRHKMNKIHHPLLLLTPNKDPRINKSNSFELYNNSNKKYIHYQEIKSHKHAKSWLPKSQKEFFKKINSFFKING